MDAFDTVVTASRNDPEAFWLDAAERIDWYRTPTRALDATTPPFYRWFADGELNICHNALDRHVADGRGEQAALIHESPVTDTRRTYTYRQLRDEVAVFARRPARPPRQTRRPGRHYMPMIPEAVIAMLACARLGAIHSVVFGGFAPKELATRINDASPTAIISASCGIEVSRVIAYKPLVDRALDIAAHRPDVHIVLQRPQVEAVLGPGDID